jgi:hypothetical protein
MVVAMVSLVCLSGWCMAVTTVAAATTEAPSPDHAHHSEHRGDPVAAPAHDGHGAHCDSAPCCRAVAKEAPREQEAPAAAETIVVTRSANCGVISRPLAPRGRDDTGPPGFTTPLTC